MVSIDLPRGISANLSVLLEASRPGFMDGFRLDRIIYNESAVELASEAVLRRSETRGGYEFCGLDKPPANATGSDLSLNNLIGTETLSAAGNVTGFASCPLVVSSAAPDGAGLV